MKLKKIVALLILSVLLLLVSCATGSEDSTQDNIADNQVETQADEPVEEERLTTNLPPVDFGGHEFTFLTRDWHDVVDWEEWNHRDLFAEQETGDIINDAVFRRNRRIEEKYNIEIKEVGVRDLTGTLRRVVRAGDDVYDVAMVHLMDVAPLALDGTIMDLFQVPYLDFDKPWWNQNTVRDLSIGNRLFVMQGDLLILDNDAMEAMIFNKELSREHNLPCPYEVVRRGEWTFDRLYDMSRGVSQDLNGDGIMNITDDRFGLILQADVDISFLVSGGGRIVSKDANDMPIVTFNTERNFRIMDAISRFMLDDQNVVNLHRYTYQFGIYDEQVRMMEENRALFSWIRMRIVERLRGMDTDFGLLPLPKLDEAQPYHITHMNPHTGAGITIPRSNINLERTGMILEDLSAESRYTLQPAYYDLNLQGKFMRDEESREMLEIILANTAYDIGYIYNFGDFAMTIVFFGRDMRTDYASTFERFEQRIIREIERTIESYENLD